jgi:high affinity sulfate transporter 1
MQAKKHKRLFWVAAIAPLISVVLATVFAYVFRVDKHGVKIVSSIQH